MERVSNKLPKLKEIFEICKSLKNWLIEKGYAGLYNYDNNCCCSIEDLLCCPASIENCVAAERTACNCGKKCEFHLTPVDKRKTEKPTIN
jgi:hypothetical protein